MGLIAILVSTAHAQDNIPRKKTIFSLGVEAGLPEGSQGIGGDYYLAIGASLQVEHVISPDFGLTLKAGYLLYVGKLFAADNEDMVPFLAGFKYRFTPKVYGSGQVGISLSTVGGRGNAFTYAPGIGFLLSPHADILARYEAASKNGRRIGNLGIRMAYNF